MYSFFVFRSRERIKNRAALTQQIAEHRKDTKAEHAVASEKLQRFKKACTPSRRLVRTALKSSKKNFGQASYEAADIASGLPQTNKTARDFASLPPTSPPVSPADVAGILPRVASISMKETIPSARKGAAKATFADELTDAKTNEDVTDDSSISMEDTKPSPAKVPAKVAVGYPPVDLNTSQVWTEYRSFSKYYCDLFDFRD